jgi:uncharacterized NAD(P)/FAD-binding protein YdhS
MESSAGIVIVGGGCSGALVAAQLLRKGYQRNIAVVEPRNDLGRGLAYSTEIDEHLLNVPAGKMSAFLDQPSHFLDWLRRRHWPDATAATFAPRRMFGEYLTELLQVEISRASSSVGFQRICGEVTAIVPRSHLLDVVLSDGRSLQADKVVLAIGNPASSPWVDIGTTGPEELIQPSPWFGDALWLNFPSDRVLLLGSGLTAVDSVLTLLSQGEHSQVFMVSRRGLLPQTHSACLPAPAVAPLAATSDVRSILAELRERIEGMKEMGYCWRVAVDALRPVSNQIWSHLPLTDKRRFVRHLKPYWEPHRHRMAPAIAAKLQRYCEDGRLSVIAGRVRRLQRITDSIEADICNGRSKDLHLKIGRVINCTGIHEDYNDSPRPLIRHLINNSLATANDLGTGFATDSNGALVNPQGSVSRQLFTLGPPRRGDLFETTAVPEIRSQAESLARYLNET